MTTGDSFPLTPALSPAGEGEFPCPLLLTFPLPLAGGAGGKRDVRSASRQVGRLKDALGTRSHIPRAAVPSVPDAVSR